MAMPTIASYHPQDRNIKWRGLCPHLAPAGTKREQTMPRLPTRVLLNEYKVLRANGRGPAKSLILLRNKNDKPLKTNKTFFDLPLDFLPHNTYI